MYIDEHKRPDIIENQKYFLKVIKELELYLLEFDKIGQIILKIHLSNYKIGKDKR